MNSYDDTVRMIQILQKETVDKDHIFNRFAWGNSESLGQKKHMQEEDLDDPEVIKKIQWLVEELEKFYDEQYSADR